MKRPRLTRRGLAGLWLILVSAAPGYRHVEPFPRVNIEVPAAMVTLRQIIEQFPDEPQTIPARNRLAMMLTQMNRHAEAAQVLEDMATHGDNPMDVWFRLGEIYEDRKPKVLELAKEAPTSGDERE